MKTAVLLFVVGVSLTLVLAEGLGIVVGLFVTVLLSGGIGFTLREFKRLSAESEARNHAAGEILDVSNVDFQKTFRHFSPKKRFSESAVYEAQPRPSCTKWNLRLPPIKMWQSPESRQ